MVHILGSMGLTIVVAKNSVAGPSLGPIDAVIILISCKAIPFARTQSANITLKRISRSNYQIEYAQGTQDLGDIAETHARVPGLNLAQGVAGSCVKLAAI